MKRKAEIFGVDPIQFRTLFRLFLTLDLRRGTTGSKRRLPPVMLNLVIYAFLGLSLAGSIVRNASPFLYALLTFAYAMFMAASAVILELSQTLVDPEEKDLLVFRPVRSRTYFAAKMANLLFYIGCVSLALSLFPALAGLALPGATWIYPLLYLPVALLSGIMTGACMAAIYATLMRILDTERLRDGIAFFQIGLTFVLIVAFQWIPRIDPDLLSGEPAPWVYGLPPAWFAGLLQVLRGEGGPVFLILGAAALSGSILLPAAGFRRISSGYLDLIRPQTEKIPAPSLREKKSERVHSHRWMADPERRAGYALTCRMLRRDRFVKMGAYPLFGIPLAFLFIAMQDGGFSDPFAPGAALGFRQSGMLFLFLFFFVCQSLIRNLTYARDWEAGWIYAVAPLASPGKLFQGVKLAVFIRLILPFLFVLFAVFATRMPLAHALKHILFLGAGGALAFSVGSFWVRDPPFSRERIPGDRLGRMLAPLLTLPVFVLLVRLQAFAYHDAEGYVIALASMAGLWIVLEWILYPRMRRIRPERETG
ncbi:MAG TPA: hypothetical protein ENN17_00095 [bacterium]|nr:hypothetical protein [bacterium]